MKNLNKFFASQTRAMLRKPVVHLTAVKLSADEENVVIPCHYTLHTKFKRDRRLVSLSWKLKSLKFALSHPTNFLLPLNHILHLSNLKFSK